MKSDKPGKRSRGREKRW